METLNVILVDDENLVIEDMLALIDWEKNGFRVAGYAYNGNQTLKLVKTVCPDIVFMDVSLPDTDGIRLSRQLRSLFPDVVIIILSGYMDFSYAQGAVEIGALSYLVKHQMTPSHLLEVLGTARETIEKNRLSRILSSRLLLRDILERDVSLSGDALEHLGSYQDPFLLLMLAPILPYPFPWEARVLIRQPRLSALQNISCDGMGVLDVLILDSYFLLFVRIDDSARIGSRYLGSLGLYIKKLQDCLAADTGLSFFALYPQGTTVLSGLYGDYQLLRRHAMDYRFCPGRKSLCIPRESSGTDSSATDSSASPSVVQMDFISQESFTGHYEQFSRQLADTFERITETSDASALDTLCRLLAGLLEKLSSSRLLDFPECCYATEIAESFLSLFQKIHGDYQNANAFSPSTNFMIQYIRENYNQNPALADTAAILNSNPVYLGQKFKKDTGRTFHDYLTEYRVEQAKILLAKTNKKIFEVSESVGISNSQYFSKIFRDLTGYTPNEYRTMHFSVQQR